MFMMCMSNIDTKLCWVCPSVLEICALSHTHTHLLQVTLQYSVNCTYRRGSEWPSCRASPAQSRHPGADSWAA